MVACRLLNRKRKRTFFFMWDMFSFANKDNIKFLILYLYFCKIFRKANHFVEYEFLDEIRLEFLVQYFQRYIIRFIK